MSKKIEAIIKRVGEKYLQVPRPLRITIGEILEGKIKLNYKGGKNNG